MTISGIIYQLFLYACILISVYFYKTLEIHFRILVFLLVFVGIIETIGAYSLTFEHRVATVAYDTYFIIGIILITSFYNRFSIEKGKYFRLISKFVMPLLLIAAIILNNLDYLTAPYKFTIYSFFVIIICLRYFFKTISQPNERDLLKTPEFYIFMGMAIFYSGSFMLMGLVNYVYARNPELARSLFSINHFLNIIHYGLITYGLYLSWKSTKSSLSS